MDDTRDRSNGEREPRTVSTPEGDNEFAPDQPLKPDVNGLQPWPSNSAMEYDKDGHSPEAETHKHTGVQRVIDEISSGKILP